MNIFRVLLNQIVMEDGLSIMIYIIIINHNQRFGIVPSKEVV